MRPERIAAELDARTPGWAVLFGHYTRQFVALRLNGPGVVAAPGVTELQRRMALVEARTRRSRPVPHNDDGTWTPPTR